MIGTTIGPCRVLDKLGEGGMGEVYRARDTRLGREVAIKCLPDAFTGDADRLMRFEREARTLASLNHPHIAQVYGLEHSPAGAGGVALVMELVEGDDLAARIAGGPIPLDEALPIARQIAEALEAAHDAGIVHRDLKPANIMVRADGTVKVLDFGLAKALDHNPRPKTPDPRLKTQDPRLPTHDAITSPAVTGIGVILGAAHMAPEQAKGKAVDKRADIWAFGCVLYEMLTGRRTFAGEDVTDTIVAVVSEDRGQVHVARVVVLSSSIVSRREPVPVPLDPTRVGWTEAAAKENVTVNPMPERAQVVRPARSTCDLPAPQPDAQSHQLSHVTS
jgi:serine/threonine protein kinase